MVRDFTFCRLFHCCSELYARLCEIREEALMEQNWPILLGIVLTRWDLDLVEQGSEISREAVASLAAMHALQPSPVTTMLERMQP